MMTVMSAIIYTPQVIMTAALIGETPIIPVMAGLAQDLSALAGEIIGGELAAGIIADGMALVGVVVVLDMAAGIVVVVDVNDVEGSRIKTDRGSFMQSTQR